MQIFTVVIRRHDIRLGSDSRRATAAGRPRRAGASASHRFHRADSLRDSMYVTRDQRAWRSLDRKPE
jgi:hypothetical protein